MQPQDDIPDIDVSLDDQPAPKPSHSSPPHRSKKKAGSGGKRVGIVAVILTAIVVLAGAVFAVYWFVLKDDSQSGETPQSTDQGIDTSTDDTQPAMSTEEASKIETFKSEKLGLELSHRADWTIEEADDGNSLTITSPNISYQTINGTVPEGKGVFTLRISKGVNSAQRDTINAAIAVQKSEVIAYTKPTDEQRHYTNISYGGTEDAFTFLMVTGSVEFNKGDPWTGKLTLSSADYYLIAGGFGEDSDNTLGFDQVATSQISSQSVKQALAIVESMQLF